MRRGSWAVSLGVIGLVLSASCGEQVVVRETEASCGNGQVEAGEACKSSPTLPLDSRRAAPAGRIACLRGTLGQTPAGVRFDLAFVTGWYYY